MAKEPILLNNEIAATPTDSCGHGSAAGGDSRSWRAHSPALHRVFYRDHPESQYPDGIRAGGKANSSTGAKIIISGWMRSSQSLTAKCRHRTGDDASARFPAEEPARLPPGGDDLSTSGT
jgi:hypothetical protein